MDLMPSYAGLAGASVPADRIIDGRDIRPLIIGEPGAKSPHEAFFYYYMDQLQAVRSGKWKLYVPLENKRESPFAYAGKAAARLFDLEADLSETADLIGRHPDVVERLLRHAEGARADLGDMGRPGKGQRPAGHHPNPTPRLLAEPMLPTRDRAVNKRRIRPRPFSPPVRVAGGRPPHHDCP